MKIKADADGKILAWGVEVTGEEYGGALPGDFDHKAGLGKYRFLGGEITEVEGWESPVATELPPVAEPEPEPEPEPEN